MKYRKKPIVVEAIQWNGKNLSEIMKFIGSEFTYEDNTDYLTNKFIYYYQENYLSVHNSQEYLTIEYGDYIIREIDGEYNRCKQYKFENEYEVVDNDV